MGDLSNLEWLIIPGNQLTGTIPTELGDLSNLMGLDLGGNLLSGTIPTELGDLASLEALWLRDNQLTGTIPTELGDLSKLMGLNLSGNELTGAIPTELGDLSSLGTLYLGNNLLTGCIPASLQRVASNDFDELGLPFCGTLTVVISIDSEGYEVRIGSPISVTATFSEPVDGFTESDVTVANGEVSSYSGSDGDSVYTFDVTPNAIGVVTVDIAAGVAQDSDSDGNTAAEQLALGIPYDDDHDGAISGLEVLAAVADYFRDSLSAQHVLQVVALYFASSN